MVSLTMEASKKNVGLIIGILVSIGIIFTILNIGIFSYDEIQIENEDVTIYSNKPYASQIVDGCKNDMHCSVNAMHTLAKIENQEIVLGVFSDLITNYQSKYPCHEIGHHLGMWLNAYIQDHQEALSIAKQQCGGAIFHGVIQNYLQIQKFNDTPLEEINIHEICSNFKNDPSFINRWQCLHGLGHGLADIYDYDISSAINRCEEFEPGLEQISCSKGVFMQNLVHWGETGDGDFDNDDLFYPCNDFEKYAPPCYHYHISYMAIKTGGINVQIPDAFDICDEITPENMIQYCYYGLGREMQSRTYLDWDRSLFLCQQGDNKKLHSKCIEGMLMTLVNINEDPSLGFSFCKGLPLEYKEDCYTGIGKWILMLSSDENQRKNICSKAEDKNNFDVCMSANIDSLKLL